MLRPWRAALLPQHQVRLPNPRPWCGHASAAAHFLPMIQLWVTSQASSFPFQSDHIGGYWSRTVDQR
jgi:hypothetical protein